MPRTAEERNAGKQNEKMPKNIRIYENLDQTDISCCPWQLITVLAVKRGNNWEEREEVCVPHKCVCVCHNYLLYLL